MIKNTNLSNRNLKIKNPEASGFGAFRFVGFGWVCLFQEHNGFCLNRVLSFQLIEI